MLYHSYVQAQGVVLGSRCISTCGSGMTAAYAALAMDLLGKPLESIPIYDGRWVLLWFDFAFKPLLCTMTMSGSAWELIEQWDAALSYVRVS